MATDHERAIRDALATSDALGAILTRIGSHAHPRSGIFAAYVKARQALRGNLKNSAVVAQTLDELRAEIMRVSLREFGRAVELGLTQAARDLARYSLALTAPSMSIAQEAALAATIRELDSQVAAIRSGLLPEERILGDAGRVGLLAPGVVLRQVGEWTARLAGDAWGRSVGAATTGSGDEFYKQAVAGIDERTTQTCLRVHGQTQPLNVDYYLTGTPRYADRLPAPPFHLYCRTSQALVPRKEVEDQLTADMRKAAAKEAALRDAPGYKPPHPANALTRVRR